jgi:DNA repair protein RadC
MSRYKIGNKVILDDQSGVIEAIYLGSESTLYDVRYTAMNIMIASNVPEEDIRPWQADEQ